MILSACPVRNSPLSVVTFLRGSLRLVLGPGSKKWAQVPVAFAQEDQPQINSLLTKTEGLQPDTRQAEGLFALAEGWYRSAGRSL